MVHIMGAGRKCVNLGAQDAKRASSLQRVARREKKGIANGEDRPDAFESAWTEKFYSLPGDGESAAQTGEKTLSGILRVSAVSFNVQF